MATIPEQDTTITDYISGVPVHATPEEIHAVQVFSKLLVSDYGYPVSHIRTRPQWRVKVRPSDTKKEYPIDIAVFSGDVHAAENVHIIVECKRPNRRDGRTQLQDYLRFSEARIGFGSTEMKSYFSKNPRRQGKFSSKRYPISLNSGNVSKISGCIGGAT